jgi:hypothetical protein
LGIWGPFRDLGTLKRHVINMSIEIYRNPERGGLNLLWLSWMIEMGNISLVNLKISLKNRTVFENFENI